MLQTGRPEYLIGMCYDERPLLREVVIKVGDDLHSYVCLPRTRRPHNLEREKKKRVRRRKSTGLGQVPRE